MPQAAASLSDIFFLRVLLMGFAKIGKTTSTIVSLAEAFGEGYVICCGDKTSLQPAVRKTKKFKFDIVRDENDFEACIKEAFRGVKEKDYSWVFVDDFSLFASWLHDELRDESKRKNAKGEADGRQFYPELKSRLINAVRRLIDLKCHVVFASHWIQPTGELSGQKAKSGDGIMPMIPGAAREELPALFNDVLFMEKLREKDKPERRVFKINPEGVWGPGSRSIDGTHDIDADFGVFARMANPKGSKK